MVFICALVFFFVCYFMSQGILGAVFAAVFGKENEFFKMSKRTVAEYHSRNVSDIHAAIALPIAFYSAYYVCDDPSKTIFSSDECLNKPHKVQLYGITISTAYVIYDLVVCIVFIGYKMKEGADFIFHHVVGIIGAVAVLIAGQFTIALSVCNLVSEFSNAFMNLRWRMLKHKMTEHSLYLPLNFCFLLSYLFSRILFMGALLVRNWEISQITTLYSHPNELVSSCAITSTAMQVMLYLIQLYWFKLIINAVIRTLEGGKPTSAADTDLADDNTSKKTNKVA